MSSGDPNVSNHLLAGLTAAKAVANGGIRWVPFFLPTLATALSATTGQMTAALGAGEMAGLSTLLIGGLLDRGREIRLLALSLVLTAAGSILAVGGSIELFAAGYVVIILGVSLCTVSGHTYLSRRVRYSRRARAIGTFEMSWALALLIGAPTAALLIGTVGWRGPFLAVAAAAVVVALILARTPDTAAVLDDATAAISGRRLAPEAWLAILASASIAICGLTTVVIAGTWLDEALGLSTGGVGAVAMAFGGAELVASFSSAAVADRVGPRLATRLALLVVVIGLAVMTRAGGSLAVGAGGLFLFFIGFEFAIVTSFSIVSEAMPSARGRVLAANNAVGTLFRGAGVAASGLLYEVFGISGPAVLSMVAGLTAALLLWVLDRPAMAGTGR